MAFSWVSSLFISTPAMQSLASSLWDLILRRCSKLPPSGLQGAWCQQWLASHFDSLIQWSILLSTFQSLFVFVFLHLHKSKNKKRTKEKKKERNLMPCRPCSSSVLILRCKFCFNQYSPHHPPPFFYIFYIFFYSYTFTLFIYNINFYGARYIHFFSFIC